MKQREKGTKSRVSNESATWFDRLTIRQRDLVCVGAILLVVYILFFKIVFSGYIFSSDTDTAAQQSWAKAMTHIATTEHVEPLWVPYIFCGMPVFGPLLFPRTMNYLETIIQWLGRLLFFGADPWLVPHYFLAGLFMYLLARQLKFSPLPSLLAAFVVVLNPYAIGLAQAGHGSKLVVYSYFALLFLLTYRLFEKRTILNFGLLAAAIGMTLLDRHPQMAFYALLAIGIYLLYEIIFDVKEKRAALAATKTGLMALAVVIGFAVYACEFLPTQEYAKFSIRGGSGSGEGGGGLTYDYATNWSLHPFELATYVIPSFFGFSSSYVTDWQGQQATLPLYWGWMPFTDAPPYIGLLPVLLAILGLMYKRNRLTWFFAILSGVVFLISFGNYFGVLYNLLFYYFPYFNKFRAPSMILFLIPMAFGILAAFGMTFLLDLRSGETTVDTVKFRKRLFRIVGVLGGLLVVGLVAKGGLQSYLSDFMFVKQGDLQQMGQQTLNVIKEKRFDLLWTDYVKMTIMAGAFLYGIILLIDKKISRTVFAALCIAVTCVDLVILDENYINPKPAVAMQEHFQPDATVKFLWTDSSLYRIFPIGELFQDNTYMYDLIPSIGGYSPAKLKMYQELIDSTFYHGADPKFPLNMNVISMLNTKYFLAAGRLPEDRFTLVNTDPDKRVLTYRNPAYLPRTWFVDTAEVTLSRRDMFFRLNDPSWNPRKLAYLERPLVQSVSRPDSSSASITKFTSADISIDAYASTPALLVVSEVYYPAGWKAFIDGSETEIYKTNYVLRSVVVPAGKHTVEFRFAPESLDKGYTITEAAWGVTLVLILAGAFQTPWVKSKLGMGKKGERVDPENPDEHTRQGT
ncbi:MAG TPA: YfhO family protein [Bacteroidota bacterium]|nr:YfhO family protein [Bacteroidota bacterium]